MTDGPVPIVLPALHGFVGKGLPAVARLPDAGAAFLNEMFAAVAQVADGVARLAVGVLGGAGGLIVGAVELAGDLARCSRPALAAVLRTVDAAFDLPFVDGRRYEVEQIQELFEHGEAREGITAFLAKRAPKFS